MKHTVIFYLSFLLLGVLVINITNLEPQQNDSHMKQQAVLESLKILNALPRPVLKELGFKSNAVIEKSSLGEPMKVYITWPGRLLKFKENDDPGEILEEVKEIHYPVYENVTPISAIIIRKRNGQWRFAIIGGKETLFAELARQKHWATGPMPMSSYFMVQIPPMYLTFLAYYSDFKLYLIPTHEHPDQPFALNQPVQAEKVFMELKRSIERYRDPSRLPAPFILRTVGKNFLVPGESTQLKITIKGLYRYKKLKVKVSFYLRNNTPHIVSMEGGSLQTHVIDPKDIDDYGVYTMERELIGKASGYFDIKIGLK